MSSPTEELIEEYKEMVRALTEEKDNLRQELNLVQEERDDLVAEKRKAGYEHEDHKAGQADLAHTSGER